MSAMTPGVPRQREMGEAGQRSANTKRENAVQNDRAARVVASRAVDAGDCRDLLDMLGLDADAARSEHRRD
jgi:hypothetical protein